MEGFCGFPEGNADAVLAILDRSLVGVVEVLQFSTHLPSVQRIRTDKSAWLLESHGPPGSAIGVMKGVYGDLRAPAAKLFTFTGHLRMRDHFCELHSTPVPNCSQTVFSGASPGMVYALLT